MDPTQLLIRSARTQDVPAIRALVEPLAQQRVLLQKEAVAYYESIQEFVVAEAPDGSLAGFGALHVIWEDIAERPFITVGFAAFRMLRPLNDVYGPLSARWAIVSAPLPWKSR